MGGLPPSRLPFRHARPGGRGGDGGAIALTNLARYGRWTAVPYLGLGEVAPDRPSQNAFGRRDECH
jgi:hypothetical protein